jgi:hypothetical protein
MIFVKILTLLFRILKIQIKCKKLITSMKLPQTQLLKKKIIFRMITSGNRLIIINFYCMILYLRTQTFVILH